MIKYEKTTLPKWELAYYLTDVKSNVDSNLVY